MIPGRIPGGRLTLASGYPDYRPYAATPSSTDTGAETVTFAVDPTWPTGTIVTPATTGGGLTNGTLYYMRRQSSTVYSFHVTLTQAVSGASPVNLTASITSSIYPFGLASQTVYYTPFTHNVIELWNGSAWQAITFTETSIALGTLNAAIPPYDLFGVLSGGALALELLAWTNTGARATEVVFTDGRLTKSGDQTRLLLGTFKPVSTTATEDTEQNRLLGNIYNRVIRGGKRLQFASHTYNSSTTRAWNNDPSNIISVMLPLPQDVVTSLSMDFTLPSTAPVGLPVVRGILDWGTGIGLGYEEMFVIFGTTSAGDDTPARLSQNNVAVRAMVKGYHFISATEEEASGNSVTVTFDEVMLNAAWWL